MSGRLPVLSPSSIADLVCGKRYHHLRVLNLWPPKTAISAVARGSAFHGLMNGLYANRSEGQVDTRDIPALAREAVQRQMWPAGTVLKDETARVEHLACTYLKSEDPEDVASTICTETTIEFIYRHCEKPLASIKATLDRVLVREEGVLTIKEYKTTPQRVELREALLLLWCAKERWPGMKYQLEYEWIDVEGTVERTIVTTDMVQGQHKLLIRSLLRVLSSPPVPEPGAKCQWCHLRPECQELAPVSLGADQNPFA